LAADCRKQRRRRNEVDGRHRASGALLQELYPGAEEAPSREKPLITTICFIITGSEHMEGKFTAVFEKDGDWWVGYVEELPGANTQGRTLEEARENLKEAIVLVIEANREITQEETHGKDVIREELTVAT
jgi:predicted RNase H-like HicB family nuclease